jgi:RNA polymerase sigma factor (sigma-70 family)
MEPLGKGFTDGDSAAFAALYDQCAVRCHHYLVARLGSRDAADEVLQEVFVRLVRHRSGLAGVENLVAYVFTIARNEAIRYAERRGREAGHRQSLRAQDLFLEARSDTPNLMDDAESAAEALRQLSAESREVVELKIYGGLTLREISDLLSLPQGTVATRYRTALARLKDWFARQPS